MGGDGGVVATNRRYMRGAGTADHTGDIKRASAADIAEAERERLQQTMRSCGITGTPLDLRFCLSSSGGSIASPIVACPYGRLYGREAAVEALLRRIEQNQNHSADDSQSPDIGWHVRGLKDLYPVRFQVTKKNGSDEGQMLVPICPITGIDLNGLQPAYLVVMKKKGKQKRDTSIKGSSHDKGDDEYQPNVLSEKAIKEMGLEALQADYGPFDEDDLIRLAPPSGATFDKIKEDLETRRKKEKTSKKEHKKADKKRKKIDQTNSKNRSGGKLSSMKSLPPDKKSKLEKVEGGAVHVARTNFASAVASNAVLSSLFTSDKSSISEKEKKDNLFAR